MKSTWAAVGLGTVLSVLGTQKVKFWLPHEWSDFKRSRYIEAISAGFAFVPTFCYYSSLYGWQLEAIQVGFWLGLVVVAAGMGLYKVGVKLLYKRYPGLEGALSAESAAQRKLVRKEDGTVVERDISEPSFNGEMTLRINKE
jgi:hypothetical protein